MTKGRMLFIGAAFIAAAAYMMSVTPNDSRVLVVGGVGVAILIVTLLTQP